MTLDKVGYTVGELAKLAGWGNRRVRRYLDRHDVVRHQVNGTGKQARHVVLLTDLAAMAPELWRSLVVVLQAQGMAIPEVVHCQLCGSSVHVDGGVTSMTDRDRS